jgi:DNA-binding NtrC family response regulator
VAFPSENIGDDLLAAVDSSLLHLPDLLCSLMRTLASRIHYSQAVLRLHGAGILQLERHGSEILSEWQRPEAARGRERRTPGNAAAAASDAVLPIDYAGQPLGDMRLRLRPSAGPGGEDADLLRSFARQCAYLVKRYEVLRWSKERLGRPLLLVGMSKSLRDLEAFVEISAAERLPVLLSGEFGTETAQVAASIHGCGPRADGPFIEVHCADPPRSPEAWFGAAEGGTLFLNGVHDLAPDLQARLTRHLPSRVDQWVTGSPAPSVRVIATTSVDLRERARAGEFSRPLLAELDFLSARVPPLRERGSDIEALIGHALARNGYRPEEKRTEALISLCKAHDWPENLFELERSIARLAAMSRDRPIELGDIFEHAPNIAPHPSPPEDREQDQPGRGDTDRGGQAEHWVQCAIDGNLAAEQNGHAALARAVRHLGRHFAEPVSLADLATHSGVSPSHLSFLFRDRLGMPFKTLLAQIRIRKARELLAAGQSRNITQIALQVGFSDLSHFERSFRRIVGQSPREFRRERLAA